MHSGSPRISTVWYPQGGCAFTPPLVGGASLTFTARSLANALTHTHIMGWRKSGRSTVPIAAETLPDHQS